MTARTLLVQARYVARDAVRAFRRNGLMSLASVSTLMVTLIVVAGSVAVVANLTHVAGQLEAQVEIVAFLKPMAPARARAVGEQIRAVPVVAAVTFVSRDEALARLQRSFAGTASLRDLVGTNPLPDSFDVRVSRGETIAATAAAIRALPGVEDVSYGVNVTERLLSLTRVVRWLGGAGTLLLMSVALIISVNTIRLTALARRSEIEIMKLVGAGAWYVRLPFLLEGGLQGLAGAAAACAITLLAYEVASRRLHASLPFVPMLETAEVAAAMVAAVCAFGLAMGLAASGIAVQRFLRV